MDYTTNYNLAKPEDGARNAGQAVNGNIDIIDAEMFKARNLITKNGEVVCKNSDVVYKST